MKYFLSKFKGAIITTIIFIALLVFIFSRDSEKPAEVAISESSYSFLLDEEIVSVEIYYAGSWVLLENDGEKWMVIEDEQKLTADEKMVDNLIQAINLTEIAGSVPTEDVDLDQFGLDTAKAELVVNSENSENRFIIGDEIPVGSGTYVYVPEEKLVLVVEKDYLSNYLNLSAEDFREKELFDFDSKAINRISISSGNFTSNIFKEEGEWYVEGDDEIFIDNKKVDEILWVFSRAKVLEFIDKSPDNLSVYGIDEPRAEIIFYEDDMIHGLVFGKRKDEDSYYIKPDNGDSVYSMHISLFKRVPKNLDQLTVK